MIKPTYHCDGPGCTAVKRDANHWILASRNDQCLMIHYWYDTEPDSQWKHFCSEACMHKVLGPFLASRSQG